MPVLERHAPLKKFNLEMIWLWMSEIVKDEELVLKQTILKDVYLYHSRHV